MFPRPFLHCTALAAFVVALALPRPCHADTVTVTVDEWNHANNGCSICGAYGYSCAGCGNEPFATSASFTDPTPDGATVTQVRVTTKGVKSGSATWWFQLNGTTVVSGATDPNGNNNNCGSCLTADYDSPTHAAFPNYVYGGTNTLTLSYNVSQAYSLAYIDITLTYEFCEDLDGDGYHGDACGQGDDCDDADPDVNPGQVETCNGVDDDCDGEVDEQDADGCTLYSRDDDGDGYGVTGDVSCLCAAAAPYDAIVDGDCDDAGPDVNPGAPETCNGVDDDCDGAPGADEADQDGDGFMACDGDCLDTDASVHPGATELCDGLDNTCDGNLPADEFDADGDGYMGCEGDCDDGNTDAHPAGTEVCDGADNDCDGSIDGADAVDALEWYLDADGDGYGDGAVLQLDCEQPDDNVAVAGDCDDADPAIHPDAEETCDGIDNDSDLATDELGDLDGDGYSICDDDCDDAEPAVYPGNPEACDGLDNDCDETTDEELDGDGDLLSVCDGDCDDDEPAMFPGNPEVCDGLDNDCDGAPGVDEDDLDGDGQRICEGECDDDDPSTFDGAAEL